MTPTRSNGTKDEKLAEQRAYATSEKSFKVASAGDVIPLASADSAAGVSRVFTSASNEADVVEVPVTDKATVKPISGKAKKPVVPGENSDDAYNAAAPAKAVASEAKIEEVSKDVEYIQAGTYGVKENAERAEKKLAPLGMVNIVPFKVNGRLLYKVKVGPLLDKKVAQLALKKVITLGHPDAMLVKEVASIAQ